MRAPIDTAQVSVVFYSAVSVYREISVVSLMSSSSALP